MNLFRKAVHLECCRLRPHLLCTGGRVRQAKGAEHGVPRQVRGGARSREGARAHQLE
jgi:hypothetical protein